MTDIDHLTALELDAFAYEGSPCVACAGEDWVDSSPPFTMCWDHLQRLQFVLEQTGLNPSQHRLNIDEEEPDAAT